MSEVWIEISVYDFKYFQGLSFGLFDFEEL